MADFCITCDVEDYQSQVENIKQSLVEQGHSAVTSGIGNDEDMWHIEIYRDDVIMKRGSSPKAILNSLSNTIPLTDGIRLARPVEDEQPIEKRIEMLCEKLHNLLKDK